MTTALARPTESHDSPALPIDVDLIKRTVAKGATDDELALYLHDCQRRGVHPLDRMLHFTKRKNKDGTYRYTPITSIDLFRSIAADTGELAGMDDATFVTESGTSYPQSATITVYRMVQGQRCPTTKSARWFEYKPSQDTFMWDKMPYTMLAKCAEALALRAAFPKQLGGLYTNEEMAQAGPGVEVNMTAEANRLPAAEQEAAKVANPRAVSPPCTPQQRAALIELSQVLSLTIPECNDVLRVHGVPRVDRMTVQDAEKAELLFHQKAVAKLLTKHGVNLDDVRNHTSLAADLPSELTMPEAVAALKVLRDWQAVPA